MSEKINCGVELFDKIKTAELYDCQTEYLRELFDMCDFPWEMLKNLKDYILKLIESEPMGFVKLKDGVLVGKNVKISKSATINAPCVLGDNTEVRPGAFIRGSVITGKNCVIGNSSEVKNSVLLDFVQVPHYNYVGDSVLGNHCHLGAGAICSNLKSDGKCVVIHGCHDYETNLRKVGAILGDGAEVGCGCVINPGTVFGKNTSAYPLVALRGVYGENRIVKATDNVVLKF